MENHSIKRGIIYTRVSSAEQVSNTSLESQEEHCRKYAERNNIEIIKIFVERGESAKTANRPEFMKALSFCKNKQNGINYFIVYKLDRFARNQRDHAVTRELLKGMGTVLRSTTETIDESSFGKAMEGVMSVFAQLDNDVRTERSKNGMLEQLKRGVWVWGAPTGYHRPYLGANIVPHPEHSLLIKKIFEEYSKGIYSYRSLSNYLDELGYRSHQGKKIFPQLVYRILRNPIYCGDMKMWGEIFKGAYEPIVSRDLFNKCQKNFTGRNNFVSSRKSNDYPLTKICFCSKCSKSLTGSRSRGSTKSYDYYHHQIKGCELGKSINKEIFEQEFIKFVKSYTLKPEYEKSFKEIVIDTWKSKFKELNFDNTRINNEINRLELKRLKVFEFHQQGKYSDEEFVEQKNILNDLITKQRSQISENVVEEYNIEEVLGYCFDLARAPDKTWKNLKATNFPNLIKFQEILFPEKIYFDGQKFGTNKVSLIYSLNEQNGVSNSKLVHPPRFERGTLEV